MTRKLVVEAIGTYFLVLTIGLVVLTPGAGAIAPLAIGSALMALVYAGGHISGAHYNPAVTLAVLLRGKATGAELVGYWVAQISGGVLAALSVRALGVEGPAGVADFAVGPALLAEFLFTFALAYVILNVATTRGTTGNSYYGLAIGFTVAAGAAAVGGISGAAFNPAVAIGVTVLGITAPGFLWVYFVANLAGGVAAAVVFNVFDMGDDKATTATAAQQERLDPAGQPGA